MPNQPNILIIMTDQQKATASHLYGNSFCETPNMARLADEGVLFENAFTPHPLCMPARVSFWTGQWPHSHGSRRNETPMPAGVEHGVRLWKEAGYHVGLIGKNHCFSQAEDLALFDTYCEISHSGLPEKVETKGMEWFRPLSGIHAAHELRRTMTPQNPHFAYATNDFPLEDYSTGLVAGQTIRFLEEYASRREVLSNTQPDDNPGNLSGIQSDIQPFALWVSIPDPHEPWVCPEQYAAIFPKEKIDLPPWRDDEFNDGTAPERNRMLYEMLGVRNDDIEDIYGLLAVYYGMVRFIDDALGQILDALIRLSLREETIIVFCSDHGDFIGKTISNIPYSITYDINTNTIINLTCGFIEREGD
ncbi:MAG: sulfatase-like hydrolase/transferase [Chloroflexota bacterium]